MGIECTYCEEKINAKHGIYVNCTTCTDIRLCLECFSSGAILAEHESNHPYELIDCGSFSIIDESWKAYEELTLLEAIELYGIGNWTDIANAVETRTAEECCERYLSVYVENFFGRCTWNAIDKKAYTVNDHTCTFKQPLSPSLSLPEKDRIVDISKEQQLRLGYMPKRDDFEREFDNEAELLVSRLAVNANDDTDLDRDFKIAHINMYIDKLRERYRRKRIVLEYNLVKLFFHMHPEENTETQQVNSLASDIHANVLSTNHDTELSKIMTPTPKTANLPHSINNLTNSDNPDDNPTNSTDITVADQDIKSLEKKIRIFCQFSSAEEHEQFIRNLVRERELKLKIDEANKRRKLGQKSNSSVTNGSESNDSDAGWRLLNESERKLCRLNNLKPSQYICYKANIMKVSDDADIDNDDDNDIDKDIGLDGKKRKRTKIQKVVKSINERTKTNPTVKNRIDKTNHHDTKSTKMHFNHTNNNNHISANRSKTRRKERNQLKNYSLMT